MIRLFLHDIVPFLALIALLTGTWLYDREDLVPAGVVSALAFVLYQKLNRIEFSLSEDLRDALLLKTDNRVVYGLAKLVLAAGVGAGVYFNHERGWVDVHGTLERLGLGEVESAPERPGEAVAAEAAQNERTGGDRPIEEAAPMPGPREEAPVTEEPKAVPKAVAQEPPHEAGKGPAEPVAESSKGPEGSGRPTAASPVAEEKKPAHGNRVPPARKIEIEED